MRSEFLEKAELLRPELICRKVCAKALVKVEIKEKDYKIVKAADIEVLSKLKLKKGDKVCLDFGRHCVGYLEFDAGTVGNPQDNPAHIKVKFGETPCEIGQSFASYEGNLSSSWLQEEYLFLDILPKRVKMPRRYAFRYVEIEVLDTSHQFQLIIENVSCITVTSADRNFVPPLRLKEETLREIDQIAVNTLEGCMQDVFEDGPKRDRRLWIGDLRLQALTNYATFQNYDLVKRCLYLFAAVPLENRKIGSCLYIEPKVTVDTALHLFDYSLFFVSCLYDYYVASKDTETLEELWPIAYDQILLASRELDGNGLVEDHPEDWWWCFIDWNTELNKQASAQAILIWTAKQAKHMADILGKEPESAYLDALIKECSEAAKKYLWEESTGFFRSGKERQISWASQVWFVIAQVFSERDNRRLLEKLKEQNPSVQMNTPYMNHCYVEALIQAGMMEEAKEHMESYWGGMVRAGADCFWEVYNLGTPELSAYGDRIMNSYCHAWSCTPSYFIRNYFSRKPDDSRFYVKEGHGHVLEELKDTSDPYAMNWVSDGGKWSEFVLPEGIEGRVERCFQGYGSMTERYVFTNKKPTDYFSGKDKIGIKLTFPDNYTSSQICMTQRCHVHIWCGGSSSYIAAMRMGGRESNLGLVLTEGSLSGYSVIRNEKAVSNDRGVFVIHPEIPHLNHGESVEVAWKLFWFDTMEEFGRLIEQWGNRLVMKLDKTVAFLGEEQKITARIKGRVFSEEVEIKNNERKVRLDKKKILKNGEIVLNDICTDIGEQLWKVQIKNRHTWARTLVLPPISELAETRCRFLVKKQQYHNPESPLDGCFLIYDNETDQMYYSEDYDYNAGRERVGMGVLLAACLQKHRTLELEESLEEYTKYVYRELLDEETGTVYNDVRRNNTWHRLYNYPWMALFFMERYKLTKEMRDLRNMYRIICAYYQEGGEKFYAIGIPMKESIALLDSAGLETEREHLLQLYRIHGDIIAERGLDYPPHEVNYEQSIVAPAVSYMLQLYQLTGEDKYLTSGKEQLCVLELFNGHQPDYHMNEVSIRHWDGYWFGKRRKLGDTFPHYWSSLTGLAYKYYAQITGDRRYYEKAENSLRGSLSMFFPDGRASCAYVYPDQVNGETCGYYDPWANDQDWGLYFYLVEGGMSYE